MFTSRSRLFLNDGETNNSHVVPNKAQHWNPHPPKKRVEFSGRRDRKAQPWNPHPRSRSTRSAGNAGKINLSTASNLLAPAATPNAGSDPFPRANLRGSVGHPHPRAQAARAINDADPAWSPRKQLIIIQLPPRLSKPAGTRGGLFLWEAGRAWSSHSIPAVGRAGSLLGLVALRRMETVAAAEGSGRRDAEAELNLPPGFRFHPTDEELVVHYLCRKVARQQLPVPIIAEVDLYKFDPWDLPGASSASFLPLLCSPATHPPRLD
jgi:hypothetical protein